MSRARRHAFWFRLFMRIAVATLSTIIVIVLVGWQLAGSTPKWYEPPADTSIVRDRAGQFETRLVEEAHNIRKPAETWRVHFPQQLVNEWLAVRLPQWVEHDPELNWPDQLGTVQARFTDAGIDVAIDLHVGPERTMQFLVARLLPRVTDDGIAFDLQQAGAGRLLLPGDPILQLTEQLRSFSGSAQFDEQFSNLLDDLAAGQNLIDREFELADNRAVRIVDLQCSDASMIVTFQTLSPHARNHNHADDQVQSPNHAP